MLEKRNLKDSSEMLAIYLGAELIGYVNFLTPLSFQLCKSNMRYFCNWKTSYFLKRKFKNFNACFVLSFWNLLLCHWLWKLTVLLPLPNQTWVYLPHKQQSQSTNCRLWWREDTVFIAGHQAGRMGSSCLKDLNSLMALEEFLKTIWGEGKSQPVWSTGAHSLIGWWWDNGDI